jgi:hypothetical protein
MAASCFVGVTDKEISGIKKIQSQKTQDFCKILKQLFASCRLGEYLINIHLDFVSINIPQ